jgi:fucose 4-O-acetylase-like acetyltransferase
MINRDDVSVDKRDDVFDIIKGICILLMIVGHCPVSTLVILIYSFHMPVFFFIAGYFFKQDTFWKTANKGMRRLLIPFVCVYFFCFAVTYVIEYFGWFSKIVMSYIDYRTPVESFLLMNKGLPVWFLVSLFWCKILFLPIKKSEMIWWYL